MKGNYLVVTLIIGLLGFPIGAAATPVVDLQLFHLLSQYHNGTDVETLYGVRSAVSVSLKSPNEGNVRGDVAFTFSYPGDMVFIDRAYLRARFPNFRLTAGKTRVSWGDGVLFNAAADCSERE